MTEPGKPNEPAAAPAAATANADVMKAFEERLARAEEDNKTMVREMQKVLRENAGLKEDSSKKDIALQSAVNELTRSRQRPTLRQELTEQIEKAQAEGDPIKVGILTSKLAEAGAIEASLRGIYGLAQMTASHLASGLSDEERAEFYSDVYVHGDPAQGFKSEELMQNFGVLGPKMAQDAKARVVYNKVQSGEYGKSIEQKIRLEDKAREEALKTQAGITGASGGAAIPAPEDTTPAETYEDRVRREVVEAGKGMRGVISHPVPK